MYITSYIIEAHKLADECRTPLRYRNQFLSCYWKMMHRHHQKNNQTNKQKQKRCKYCVV